MGSINCDIIYGNIYRFELLNKKPYLKQSKF